jgi:mono/diheme cytochrome c family protein
VRSLRSVLCLALLSVSIGVYGCEGAPPDRREWKASDHDRQEQASGKSARPPQTVPGPGPSAANPTLTLVEVTWRNQCAVCHGVIGRGDGPQGPMVHAPNLTLPEWQAKATDEEIAHTILNGKNRMPKFEFPPEVVTGLVARIRATKGR